MTRGCNPMTGSKSTRAYVFFYLLYTTVRRRTMPNPKKRSRARRRQPRVLSSANIVQLSKLRRTHHPIEIAGRLDFTPQGILKHVSLRRGNDNASDPGHCDVCYHSHPDHSLPSPPSATDLMSAYITPARLHVLMAREGLYVFRCVRSTPLGKAIAKHHSLQYTRKHWISEHVRQAVLKASVSSRPTASQKPEAVKRRTNRLLRLYYDTVHKKLGIRVRYYPWGSKRISLG